MIDVRKLVKVADIADRESSMLASTMRRSNIVNNIARAKLYKEEEKLQRLREDTFSALAKELGGKGKKGGLTGVLIGALGLGGAGRVVRRFGGGGGRGGGGGNVPKLPRGPLGKSLSKFGRIGPLAIASTGLDFFARKQSGQSNLQAGGGALAGLGGFAGGAKIGATLGTMIAPGVGTAVGGVLGGALGGLAGGNLFDRLYGQNMLRAGSDFRRVQEEEATRQESTLFGENLDKFDIVLEKFAKKAPVIGETEEIAKNINQKLTDIATTGAAKPSRFPVGKLLMTLVDMLAVASAVTPTGVDQTVSIPYLATRFPSFTTRLKKLQSAIKLNKFSKAEGFTKFSQKASKIKPETLVERMTRAFKANKLDQPIAYSKKGQIIREGSRLLDKIRANNLIQKIAFPKGRNYTLAREAVILIRSGIKGSKGKLGAESYTRSLQAIKNIRTGMEKNLKIAIQNGDKAAIKDIRKAIKYLSNESNRVMKKLLEYDSVDDIIDSATTIQGEAAKRDVLRQILKDNKISDKILKPGYNPKTKRFIKKEDMTFKGEGTSTNKRLPDNLNNSDGGVMEGPESGYLAILHGKERIIPEENQYTRSKGGGQRMKRNTIMMVEGNNSQPQQVMQTPKTQVVPIFVPADPFDVATKYSELIAKVTV